MSEDVQEIFQRLTGKQRQALAGAWHRLKIDWWTEPCSQPVRTALARKGLIWDCGETSPITPEGMKVREIIMEGACHEQ